ncbi:MAG: hypothetical protein AAFR11_15620 [Pseudomonadota bacterium]
MKPDKPDYETVQDRVIAGAVRFKIQQLPRRVVRDLLTVETPKRDAALDAVTTAVMAALDGWVVLKDRRRDGQAHTVGTAAE